MSVISFTDTNLPSSPLIVAFEASRMGRSFCDQSGLVEARTQKG